MENKTNSLESTVAPLNEAAAQKAPEVQSEVQAGAGSRLHLDVLRSELNRRKQQNARYSMRGFATDLGIEASTLCRILAGKQSMSVEMTSLILERLALDSSAKLDFVRSVANEKYEQVLQALASKIGLNQPGL